MAILAEIEAFLPIGLLCHVIPNPMLPIPCVRRYSIIGKHIHLGNIYCRSLNQLYFVSHTILLHNFLEM